MAEQSAKRVDTDAYDADSIANQERPPKRARMDADGPDVASTTKQSEDMDDEWEEEDATTAPAQAVEPRAADLYLDTVSLLPSFILVLYTDFLTTSQISRQVLDFDFEKVCSVSLSNINIYGCLVCGKYFQGRGRNSYAYAHSIHDDHHVFINLESNKVRFTTSLVISTNHCARSTFSRMATTFPIHH
jgi:U4/U6.U5 tri-snRNP-associated protein 2